MGGLLKLRSSPMILKALGRKMMTFTDKIFRYKEFSKFKTDYVVELFTPEKLTKDIVNYNLVLL